MPHRQSWFHGTYDKLTNTLSYFYAISTYNSQTTVTNGIHILTLHQSQASSSLRFRRRPIPADSNAKTSKWGTVHLRPEPIIAPQPRSPSNHCPAAAGGKGPEPVPHTPLMDSPRAGRGSQSLATNTTKQTQWLTVGLEPGFSGPSLTEQNHCSNPALRSLVCIDHSISHSVSQPPLSLLAESACSLPVAASCITDTRSTRC